ncbi:MAG: heparin lyase I family protein, partial [Candidatus Sumerlaeia bacterium]|nr:heparin lyase I family protein [Candidatus Sumerlaeia bacterium]
NWGEGKYSRDKHRQVLWAIYMAGGAGSVGDRGDMPDGKERPYKSGNWREIPEYADIRNLAHFFGSGTLEYWKMSPHNELVKSGARVYVLAEPARQYAVYAAVGGTFSLDLVPGSYRCARFDPRSGETTALPDITGGRAVSFSCPDSQDWVFSLTTISTASAMEKQDKPASSQSANSARQHLIESVTEDIAEARGREFTNSKGGPQHNKLANVSSPVRAGKAAFQHWVDQKGERSELAMMKTEIGGTYWYGWAMYLPDTFEFRGSATIVMQLATYPTLRTRRFPCKANGPFLHINSKGALVFHHQHKGDTRDAVCDEFILADDVSALRDRWLDFVMHAKWTGDPDGFLRVWMKIGNEPYVQKIDYKGRTWWNDEDKGPYFKMGAYMGDPGWKGPPERTLYTDEYRLGDAQVRFEDVAPGGEPMPTPAVQ